MDVAVLIGRNVKLLPKIPVCISTGSSPTPSLQTVTGLKRCQIMSGLRRSGVNWSRFELRLWTVNWRENSESTATPPNRLCHSHDRLRHWFTTFWQVGKPIHNFSRLCQVRFTTWTPQFTTWFTTFGKEKAQMVISVQRSPFLTVRSCTLLSPHHHSSRPELLGVTEYTRTRYLPVGLWHNHHEPPS